MSVYDNLISILFKLPDGRSLNEYYKNVLLVGKIETTDLQPDVEFPASGLGKYSSYEEVIAVFKPTSQFAIEANAIFNQKSNTQTTSQVQYVLIANQTSLSTIGTARVDGTKLGDVESIAQALDRAKGVDGRFAKVVPISREAADLEAVASWCLTNKRFCDLPVTDVDNIANIVAGGNNYAYGVFSKSATNPIASAVASCATCGYFGGKDGSAQFTQLTGILPETYTGQEISEMNTNNVAYYTNVSPIDGGQTEGFGYNWVIGSRMLGGEFRQRQMIKDYIEKDMGLMALEFFNQKPIYDETGNNLLLSMAQKRFRSYQTYNLVIQTTNEQTGFDLKVIPIRTGADSIMNTDVDAYNAKKFKLQGYYYDAIVGEKVDFLLYVDPSDEQIEQIIGGEE